MAIKKELIEDVSKEAERITTFYDGIDVTFDHWAISPCPSYFDCGDDKAYGIYPVDSKGNEGECLILADGPDATWILYQICEEVFGYAIRSNDWRFIY